MCHVNVLNVEVLKLSCAIDSGPVDLEVTAQLELHLPACSQPLLAPVRKAAVHQQQHPLSSTSSRDGRADHPIEAALEHRRAA